MYKAEVQKKRRQTPRGWCKTTFNTMRANSKRRNMPGPDFTYQEFANFIEQQPHFYMLFDNWKKSDFDRWYRPSLDRIDNNKRYSFDNVRLVTWKENHLAACNPTYYREVTRWAKSKFKKDDILFIREASKRGLKSSHLAELYCVAQSTICMIIKGNNWSDIK